MTPDPADVVTIIWSPSDVASVSNLTEAEARVWLQENGKYLIDRSIELGWDIIDSLLEPDERQLDEVAP